MVAVPKIWDTIKKAIVAKVSSSSPVAQALVNTALQWRAFAITIGLDTPLFNVLVFKKFKKFVGGNIKHAISGGGKSIDVRYASHMRLFCFYPLSIFLPSRTTM